MSCCKRKVKYDNFIAADNARRHAMQSVKKKLLLYVYQCPDCDGWHLTKMMQKKRVLDDQNIRRKLDSR